MHIKCVTYTVDDDIYNKEFYTNNLSSLFYSLPCVTRSEVRLVDEVLFPNSKHKLLTTTFDTQDDLMKAWEIVNRLTVKVEYHGPIKRFRPTYRSLSCDYRAFIDVMKDPNGDIRKLKAFLE